ncbi:hypothetical protein PRZ48_003146 [Zasmidium cellare]|uniref:FAD/NAD(P)-binding domain-containing protein n=1 Tax=Zasmidium cellare TaxID=395010 RepID=A0ABR0EVT1_ZASCE|nr:hypothetical protein PRZ48_003146 [Zasmidium cellare]
MAPSSTLEKTDFQPKSPPTDPRAARFVPKFIYCDPKDPNPVDIKEELYGSRRKLRVGILGAGITCLDFLHHLFELVPEETVEIVIYDKNEDVGGVWQSSVYPGCRCDSPSPVYQFSWRTHVFSQFHAPQPEIRDYLQQVARENGWYKYMNFRHEVTEASWRDDEAKWTLQIRDTSKGRDLEEKFDLFVELNGPVSSHRITVPGINAFEGRVVHPGDWPRDLDLNNKRVALLGYGCTGVQVAPNILPSISKLYTWFRNKAYMTPSPHPNWLYDKQGTNFHYSDEQKELLKDPDVYLTYRKAIDDPSNRRFDMMINGSENSQMVSGMIKGYMQSKLQSKPELYDAILPTDYAFACRRPTMVAGYLEALVDPKTTVYQGEPTKFTAKGFIDPDGNEQEVDIIIAATGYDQDHMPRYPKTVNGEDIAKRWAARQSGHTYMAVCSENMPNYFNPGTAYSALYRNWFQNSEFLSKYMAKVINKIQLENVLTFTPKPRAVDHFVKHADTFMQRMVQAGPCSAWYKDNVGRPALWPGSHSHYMQILSNPRFEDFDFTYEDEEDMFSYFGNGFTLHPEGFEEDDSSWYMGQPGRVVPKEEMERLRGVYGRPQWAPNLREEKEREEGEKGEGQVKSSL